MRRWLSVLTVVLVALGITGYTWHTLTRRAGRRAPTEPQRLRDRDVLDYLGQGPLNLAVNDYWIGIGETGGSPLTTKFAGCVDGNRLLPVVDWQLAQATARHDQNATLARTASGVEQLIAQAKARRNEDTMLEYWRFHSSIVDANRKARLLGALWAGGLAGSAGAITVGLCWAIRKRRRRTQFV